VDLERRAASLRSFPNPAAAIIKHNILRTASRERCVRVSESAACDPVSAFGGVLAFNRVVDAATAEEVAKLSRSASGRQD